MGVALKYQILLYVAFMVGIGLIVLGNTGESNALFNIGIGCVSIVFGVAVGLLKE